MATATVMSAMNADSDKSVHPFFTKQHAQQSHDEATENAQEDKAEKPTRTNSKRKKAKNDQKLKTQKTLGEIVNPKSAAPIQTQTLEQHVAEPDASEGRRKRRRSNDGQGIDVGLEDNHVALGAGEHSGAAPEEGRRSPIVLIPVSSPLPQKAPVGLPQTELTEHSVASTPPKKLLRLNAQGRFSSPPSKKPKDEDEITQGGPRRSTRQRKPAKASTGKLVILSYAGEEAHQKEIGNKIQRILDGEEQVAPVQKTDQKTRTPQKSKPRKPTHPFFSKDAASAKTLPPKHESPRKASAITPGKLRMQSLADRLPDAQDTSSAWTSELLKDRLVSRHPGLKEAPFPAKEQAHVRNLDTMHGHGPRASSTELPLRQRKKKHARVPFPDGESVLSRFKSRLDPEDERVLRPDGFLEPEASLQLPGRLLISGQEIQDKIASQLSVSLTDSDVDELSIWPQQRVHPALRRLHRDIPRVMTAFDQSRGESQAWPQRYAPSASELVLQPTREISTLRDWMKSLAVQSVTMMTAPASKAGPSKAAEKPKKKRKKKSSDMDDFLVESDEEINDMSEIIDDGIGAGTSGTSAHSIVQALRDGTKLSNAVLLSGPHGCGKTAAAYAVAKELGFKVFEISSNDRRSGRDVLDRVGNMTENHLVKHHGVEDAGELSSTEEPSRLDEAFQKDLQTGRQGKMNAFFKPQGSKKKADEPKRHVKEKVVQAIQETLKKPAKEQQQSLILLEEVDILFREDKEFWTTVLKLISTSKRPFIMTCNDEDLVPLQAMSLHAILRFVPPPADLATDYMLLLAAAEGHLLKRDAVSGLYAQHGYDLRASVTELDCWCQMGVGDPREGLSWIYQRWPPGSDLDDKGRILRVVSDGTYQQGMGVPSKHETLDDGLLWLWAEHDIEPSVALGWQNTPPEESLVSKTDDEDQVRALKRYACFSESLSAADACSSRGLPGVALLDTSQKPLSDKSRGQYIEGLKLLQTDEQMDWTEFTRDILVSMTASTYRMFTKDDINGDDIVLGALARKPHSWESQPLSRHTFACFDVIAAPIGIRSTGPDIQQSVFDGTFQTIALDLAPYVRSIVQYDQALEEQRERLDLLTCDGRRAKRARTTRAARSALEGGVRATVRRDRWFGKKLDMAAVLATGGDSWPRFSGNLGTASVASKDETETEATRPSTAAGSEENL